MQYCLDPLVPGITWHIMKFTDALPGSELTVVERVRGGKGQVFRAQGDMMLERTRSELIVVARFRGGKRAGV